MKWSFIQIYLFASFMTPCKMVALRVGNPFCCVSQSKFTARRRNTPFVNGMQRWPRTHFITYPHRHKETNTQHGDLIKINNMISELNLWIFATHMNVHGYIFICGYILITKCTFQHMCGVLCVSTNLNVCAAGDRAIELQWCDNGLVYIVECCVCVAFAFAMHTPNWYS